MATNYYSCLVSNWSKKSTLKQQKPNKHNVALVGFVDKGESDLTYPINPLTGNRETQLVRALDARTPAIVRNQLLNSIESLPPDPDLSGLTDDDKLAVCKSRYCQSRPEMAEYYNYLQRNIIKDLPQVEEVLNKDEDGVAVDVETKKDS